MSKYSVVIIVPAAYRDAVNAAAEANGHGPDNINVPLSDGNGITHYGTRTFASQAFVDSLDSYPQALRDVSIIDRVDDAPGIGATHWNAVLAANNLARVEEV